MSDRPGLLSCYYVAIEAYIRPEDGTVKSEEGCIRINVANRILCDIHGMAQLGHSLPTGLEQVTVGSRIDRRLERLPRELWGYVTA